MSDAHDHRQHDRTATDADAAQPAAEHPGAMPPAPSYPGAGYPAGVGGAPQPGYGTALLPHHLRPLPPHIDPSWRLAGVGRRAAGRIIDHIVFTLVAGLSMYAWIVPLLDMAQRRIDDLQLYGTAARDMNDSYFGGALLAALISVITYLLILSWWLGWKGTTPGKAIVGIRVQRFSQPGMLGFGRALVRGIVQNVFIFVSILAWLPYASVGWDSSRLLRGWHDLAADDVVLARRTEAHAPY